MAQVDSASGGAMIWASTGMSQFYGSEVPAEHRTAIAVRRNHFASTDPAKRLDEGGE